MKNLNTIKDAFVEIENGIITAFGSMNDWTGIDDWSNLVTIDPEFYRPAEVDYLCGNASKAKNRLGWVPKYGLEELVQAMLEHDLDENLQNIP